MTALQLWIPYEDSGLVEFLAREDWPDRIAHASNVLDLLG
nr:D165 [uncultured bacterium]